MKRLIIVIQLLAALPCFTQGVNEIKNVILLIPDGSSTDLISLARWFNGNKSLAMDEIICGMIKTHSIDNRFPDSAPTATAYASGIKSVSGYIGVDSAAMPRISVMELAKLKGLSTGVVVTSEYPHATPAGFICHYPDRKNYRVLTEQFLYSSPTVVFAGGKGILDTINNGTSLLKFRELNYKMITGRDQLIQLQYNKEQVVWGLFPDWNNGTECKSYQCDITASGHEPSLSEMTGKAIELLRQNENGFFLVVEGSQVDWACHNNDPFAAVTDFLEFDKAVGISLDFAKTDSSTVVIVCPDHGNGGLSIGNSQSNVSFTTRNPDQYDKIDIHEKVIVPLKQIKCSGRKLAEMILADPNYANADTIRSYFSISDPSVAKEIQEILKRIPGPGLTDTIQYVLGRAYSDENFIGWTTTGHTAEDVFLGIYVPEGAEKITGVVDNTMIAEYIAVHLKLGSLRDSTERYFCRADLLFKNDREVSLQETADSLVIRKKSFQLVIYANTNRACLKINGNTVQLITLPTVAVCIPDKKQKPVYYLPENLYDYFH